MKNPEYWKFVANLVDFAFQPIVDIETGVCYGVEALLRGQERVGYATIPDLFEAAYQAGMLHRLEVYLREQAFQVQIQDLFRVRRKTAHERHELAVPFFEFLPIREDLPEIAREDFRGKRFKPRFITLKIMVHERFGAEDGLQSFVVIAVKRDVFNTKGPYRARLETGD